LFPEALYPFSLQVRFRPRGVNVPAWHASGLQDFGDIGEVSTFLVVAWMRRPDLRGILGPGHPYEVTEVLKSTASGY